MKRRVNIGEEFEGEISVVEEISLNVRKHKLIDAKVRAVIAITVTFLGSGFILGAALMGFVSDPDFAKLQITWGIVGPIFGLIGGYYYKSSPEE